MILSFFLWEIRRNNKAGIVGSLGHVDSAMRELFPKNKASIVFLTNSSNTDATLLESVFKKNDIRRDV